MVLRDTAELQRLPLFECLREDERAAKTVFANGKCCSGKKVLYIITKTFNIETELSIREKSHVKKGKVYFVEIADPEQIQAVLQGTKLLVNGTDGGTLFSECFNYTA